MSEIQGRSDSYRAEIWKIAIPAIFEQLMLTFVSMIDSKMVAGLGNDAIAAVAVTVQPQMFILCFFTAIQTVLSALVANRLGRKDRRGANSVFLTAMLITVLGAIVIGGVSAWAADPIMQVCSGQKETMAMSVTYFRILILGTIFNASYCTINAGLRGCGKTKVTFFSNLISCTVNIFFNYLLIGGNWGFPALGIAGAAIATVIGYAAASVFCFIYLKKAKAFLNMRFCIAEKIRPTAEALREIFAGWKHIFLQNVLMRVGSLFSSALTARIGPMEMSVYHLGNTWLNVIFAFGNGFLSAGVALVGRSCGAADKKAIRFYSSKIVRISLIVSLLLAPIILLTARPYYLFYADGLVGAEKELFLQTGFFANIFIAAMAPIQTTKIATTGLLQGLGRMKQTMIAAIVSVTVLQPICNGIFILWLHWGIWGIWVSMFLSQLCWFLTTRMFFRKTLHLPEFSEA